VTGAASELVYVAVMSVTLGSPGGFAKAKETLMPSLAKAVTVGSAGGDAKALGAAPKASPKEDEPSASRRLLGAAEAGPASKLRRSCRSFGLSA
jgi:hypothetical protein